LAKGNGKVNRLAIAFGAALLAIGAADDAAAQDAAESAIIMSGTGQTVGKAQRGLGASVANSMNSAQRAITSGRPLGRAKNRRGSRKRSRARGARGAYRIPAGVDFLQGIDAPTYQLGNGSSIKVSGGLRPNAETTCVKNCPDTPAP